MKPITRFTFLGFNLNSLLDKDKMLDVGETKNHIEDGTLFGWLKNKFEDDVDLSIYSNEEKKTILELFKSLVNTVDEERKMGVSNNGLSLLVAYCFEGIQQLR